MEKKNATFQEPKPDYDWVEFNHKAFKVFMIKSLCQFSDKLLKLPLNLECAI